MSASYYGGQAGELADIGATRACPDCGRPQHYSGVELGWCHDALIDTWHCADPAVRQVVADDMRFAEAEASARLAGA